MRGEWQNTLNIRKLPSPSLPIRTKGVNKKTRARRGSSTDG